MAISLYDASVGTYLQGLNGVVGCLEKALAHCKAENLDTDALLDVRLAADMLPLRIQIQVLRTQSIGSIESLKAGTYAPPMSFPQANYAELQALVKTTIGELQALTPEEVNALADGDCAMVYGDMRLPFTAENFILSFALPNFYFHLTTTYDILRAQGVNLGKADFLGPFRLKA